MQIEIKEVEPCKLSVQYHADAGEILNKRGEVINAFKRAPVPGFRPGKATDDAIRMHYRTQIEDSLKRALAEDAYHNTLFEKKLRPHGAPKFNSMLFADGKFSCEFELFIKPEFELAPYKDLEVPKPHAAMGDIEIAERMIQELRVRFGEVVPFAETDVVQLGDNVIIDYEGSLDGQKIDNLCVQGEMATVGTSTLPSFDDNLIGMTLGQTKEFEVVIPENGLPSVAGKTVKLKVTLNTGSKTTPCPLDDSLAVKVGKKNIDELRKFVSELAMGRTSSLAKSALNESVANKLVTDTTINVPDWLSLSEAQYLAHNSKLDWSTMSDLDKEKFIELGRKNVKLSLILDKIRENEPGAQLTDQEVFEVVKHNLANTKMQASLDDVIKEMNRTGYLQILFSRIRDEHTLDFIVKTVKVIE